MSIFTSKKSECERAFLIWVTSFVRLDIFLNVKNVSMSISVKKTVSSRYTVDIQLCTFKFSTSYTPFIHVHVHCTININEILLKLIDNF